MLLLVSWVCLSVFFGTSFFGLSYLSHRPMPLEFMMFYRLMLSSAILVLIILCRRQRLLIKKNEILLSIVVSVSQLNVWLQAYSTKYIISGLVSCVCLLQIFVAELVGAIYEKRMMRGKIILSGILGSVGLVMLLNQQLFSQEVANLDVKNTIIGVAFAFVSTFAAVIGNLVYEKNGKILNQQMPRTTFLLYNCFFGGLMLLVLGLIIHPCQELFNPALKDVKYVGVMSYLALTATVISLLAMYYIVEKQGAVKVAYVNFIMPILSMLVSTFAEGYKWDIISATGLVVMLISVWLGIRPDKKRTQQQ